jgi:hypothetical protein
VTVPTAGSDSNAVQAAFVEPLVVDEGTTVEITIVEDMIHTLAANVSGGQPSFDLSLPLPPVSLFGTAGDVTSGSVEYYTPIGTGNSTHAGLASSGNEAAGALRVFFVNGKPAYAWHVVPSNSQTWAADPRSGSGERAGGFLGLDSTGTLCWAHSSNGLGWSETGYASICRMHRPTNIGETTTIECKHENTVPAPTSGATYESGCPAFAPDDTMTVTLVAK